MEMTAWFDFGWLVHTWADVDGDMKEEARFRLPHDFLYDVILTHHTSSSPSSFTKASCYWANDAFCCELHNIHDFTTKQQHRNINYMGLLHIQ